MHWNSEANRNMLLNQKENITAQIFENIEDCISSGVTNEKGTSI